MEPTTERPAERSAQPGRPAQQQRLDRVLQGNLPLPLARLYARAHHAKGERERHDHAFHLVETTLKLAAAALVARYRCGEERSKKVDSVLRYLALPSLGQWWSIFRETLKFLGTRSGADAWSRRIFEATTQAGKFPQLQEIFRVLATAVEYQGRSPSSLSLLDVLEFVPTYRNVMSSAHGAIKADTGRYRQGIPALLGLARVFFEGTDGLGGGQLVFAEEVRSVRQDERQVVWVDLTGPTAIRRHPPESSPAAAAVSPGQLYLEILPRECYLPLNPLLCYQHGDMLDQVFYLNRARGGRSGIQFLCYETGEFYLPGRDPDGDQLVRDLERLLSWITSSEVDARRLALLVAQSRSEALGAAEPPPQEAPPGEGRTLAGEGRALGDFEVLGELGRGGMAIVYLARQRSLERQVALKVLPLALREEHTTVARFKQEVRALARCDHPNVVKILSSGEAEGTYYYAMEYIDGADLATIAQTLKRYRSGGAQVLTEEHFNLAATTAGKTAPGDHAAGLPQVDRLEHPAPPRLEGRREIAFRLAVVLRDAARGVQHIHEQGMIHRDLKPQNIMITRDSHQPVVMDLGLAKMTGLSRSLTADTGTLLGTLRYMAPEQLQRNMLEVGARADVYSLGAVLYELACGRPLLDGDTEERLTKQILFEKPPAPQQLNPRLPGDLATIIEKATRKDPRERYTSAAELAEDLDRFAHGEAISAREPTLGYLLKVSIKTHRRLITAVSLATLLVVGASLVVGWYRAAAEFHASMLDGRRSWTSYLHGKADLEQLQTRWQVAQLRHQTWEPVWERQDELEAWRQYRDRGKQLEYDYNGALLAFHRAHDLKWIGTKKRSLAEAAVGRAYWVRYRQADEEGVVGLPPEFFKLMIQSLETPLYTEEFEGGGRVLLESDPPGAEVYCFRYQDTEEHLVPLPFAPQEGHDGASPPTAAEPFLEVETVRDFPDGRGRPPFTRGDRLLAVGDERLRTRGDLARVLARLRGGEELEVKILRDGSVLSLPWLPFSPPQQRQGEDESAPRELSPGRLTRIPEQLGFTLAGYPLDFTVACRLGTTRSGSPLKVKLPRGSYLLVLRQKGYGDTRLPVAIPPTATTAHRVRLFKPGEIPEDFLHVPAGTFACGGDREASQSLDFHRARVDDFFIARHEVTVGQYLDFVNDPNTLARVDRKTGKAEPLADWSGFEAKNILPLESSVQIIPTSGRSLLCDPEEVSREEWRWVPKPGLDLDGPVFGLSMLSGVEYAHWRTEKTGGKWRFRLPTDLEWERAARGADRRIYVWGNYPIWSFCSSPKGTRKRRVRGPVGRHAMDESVFGVRDMAGSVSEVTTDKTTVATNNLVLMVAQGLRATPHGRRVAVKW